MASQSDLSKAVLELNFKMGVFEFVLLRVKKGVEYQSF